MDEEARPAVIERRSSSLKLKVIQERQRGTGLQAAWVTVGTWQCEWAISVRGTMLSLAPGTEVRALQSDDTYTTRWSDVTIP